MEHKHDQALPDPAELKQTFLTLAVLDVAMCDTDWLRVHRYEHEWTEGVQLGSIVNGAGDDLYAFFSPAGVFIKGFDHESPFSPHARETYEVWPGMYDEVPYALMVHLDRESALEKEDVTFCWWRGADEERWRTGKIERPDGWDDGFNFLLGYVNPTPEAYADWAESYFEIKPDLETVRQVYAGANVTAEIIRKLNPERDTVDALNELKRLGF